MSDNRTETERLYDAIQSNNARVVAACIGNGVDVNNTKFDQTTKNLTPLEFAIQCNHLKIVKTLIEQGANFDSKHPDSPLIHCLRENRPEIAMHLIQMGADINQPDVDGKTPLSWAISLKNEELVDFFLEFRAKLTRHKDLIDAIETDHLRIVQILLQRGASVDSHDDNGLTPLLKCLQTHRLDFERLDEFLSKGVVDVQLYPMEGVAPSAAVKKQLELAKDYIKKKATINEFDNMPPIEQIKADDLINPNLLIMEKLIRYGADVNLVTKLGSPLMQCIESGKASLVRRILEAGADVNKKTNGVYPIMYAIGRRNLEIVKILVESGARLTVSDSRGDTPLLKAVGEGKFAIVEYLVGAGADLNKVNNLHETVLTKALANSDFQTLNFLIQAGADEGLMAREAALLEERTSATAAYLAGIENRKSPAPE